jgi:very-short-patch-repair endonuclease
LSAGQFSLAGLPTPELQFPIRTSTGTYYPDFYWPEHHLIGECDGMVKYTDPAAQVAEKVREDSLRALGNRFVRWLGREVMATPGVVVGRVSRALGL